jgi:hypothetical protein
VRQMDRIVGEARIKRLNFVGHPKLGVGTGPRRTWRVYTPPPAGTSVLVITNLGQRPSDAAMASYASLEDWVMLHRRLAKSKVSLTILTPCPREVLPRWARDLRTITWDRSTRPGTVRRTLHPTRQ